MPMLINKNIIYNIFVRWNIVVIRKINQSFIFGRCNKFEYEFKIKVF